MCNILVEVSEGTRRPPKLEVDPMSNSLDISREASQSIKAAIDSPLTSTTARCSEDLTLRQMNNGSMNLGILSTTEKYGHSSPRRLTPRSSRRGGSSTSGQTVAARSNGGGKNSGSPRKYSSPIRELDRMAIEAKAPPRFICPISGRVMRDPVILATGTTCDRGALEKRLANGNKRCPVTNKNLRVPISMTANSELRHAISSWAKKNAPWMMNSAGMFLVSNDPGRYEIQGSDVQYVSTPGSAGPNRTPSRIDGSKGQWLFTNGSKARPGQHLNMTASPGTLEAGGVPWYTSRGIASPRSSRKSSRSRTSRGRSPKKSSSSGYQAHEWYSLGFLGVISVVYLAMFLLSLSFDNWKLASLSDNPWYGPTADALVDAGALVLPRMNAPGNEWWRLISSVFLPAGLIQMIVCLLFLWLFGFYARSCMPFPQASLAGLFLSSSIVGSLVSANLNGKYVSCGPFSGILSLFAVLCVNQPLEWPRRKLLNLKEWYLIALLLTITGGGLITLSLFPLIDIWFTLGGLLAGICMALIIIMIPRVQSKALEGRTRGIWVQSIAGAILLGVIVAASVGCALPTKLGQSVDILGDFSCIEFSSSMNCVPYGYLDNGCGLTWQDEAVYVACPDEITGDYQYYQTNATFADIGDSTIVETECLKSCDKRTETIEIISVPPASSMQNETIVPQGPSVANGPIDSSTFGNAAKAPSIIDSMAQAPKVDASPTAPKQPEVVIATAPAEAVQVGATLGSQPPRAAVTTPNLQPVTVASVPTGAQQQPPRAAVATPSPQQGQPGQPIVFG